MTRKLKLLAAFGAVTAVTGGVALAASSPSVSTSSATSIKSSSAVLRGTINPNGASTTYQFEWGLAKDVYGALSPIKSAGHGTTAQTFSSTAGGLLPGTPYHYRLIATNRFGSSTGTDRTFKTAGHPPPSVATGGVSTLGANSATLTGVVNPQGEATTFFFQYGTTTAYGLQTFGAVVPAGTATVPVSQSLTGLSQFTTFHYRLVAQHGSVTSYGNDQAFITYPSPRPVPRLSAGTNPRRDRFAPYVFTTTGSVQGPSFIPASLGCVGNVTVRLLLGRRTVAFNLVPLQPNCTYSSFASFRHLPGRGRGRRVVNLHVRVFFRGNGYLSTASAKPGSIALGRT